MALRQRDPKFLEWLERVYSHGATRLEEGVHETELIEVFLDRSEDLWRGGADPDEYGISLKAACDQFEAAVAALERRFAPRGPGSGLLN